MTDLMESMAQINKKMKNNVQNDVHHQLAENLVQQAKSEGIGIEQLFNNLTKKVVELSLEAE